ncbi:hypothetical protein [Staphylococcus massiliensis]|uniref:Beta-galactosidase n=1 Tax=Staphylococcus massiliensis S46 TaxID=1229783 RepID=K9B2K7_9STAP|nr:hypothetical protein [Staphylococcus massiliensis]EKU49032.1 beta-galactosidase [Staphylococcus massiliensis S46]
MKQDINKYKLPTHVKMLHRQNDYHVYATPEEFLKELPDVSTITYLKDNWKTSIYEDPKNLLEQLLLTTQINDTLKLEHIPISEHEHTSFEQLLNDYPTTTVFKTRFNMKDYEAVKDYHLTLRQLAPFTTVMLNHYYIDTSGYDSSTKHYEVSEVISAFDNELTLVMHPGIAASNLAISNVEAFIMKREVERLDDFDLDIKVINSNQAEVTFKCLDVEGRPYLNCMIMDPKGNTLLTQELDYDKPIQLRITHPIVMTPETEHFYVCIIESETEYIKQEFVIKL